MPDYLNYVEYDYAAEGYVVGERRAAADVNSTGSVVATATRITSASAALTSAATVAAIPYRKITGSAALASEDTFTVTVSAKKNFVAGLTATAAVAATGTRIKSGTVLGRTLTWTDQDDWYIWEGVTWDGIDGLATQFIFDVVPTISGTGFVSLNAAFATYNNGGYLKTASAAISDNQSAVSTVGGYLKEATADLTAAFSQTSLAGRTSPAQASLSAAFVLASRSGIPGPVYGEAALSTAVTQSTAGTRRVSAQGAITAAFTETLTLGGLIARGQAALSVQASITESSLRLNLATAAMSSNASLSGTARRVKPFAAALSSAFSHTVNGGYLRLGSKDLQSAFAVYCNTREAKTVGGSSALSALFFELTAGRRVPIDPDFTLRVAQESRYYPVLLDLRLLQPECETRVNIVLSEQRGLRVPQETRQETVL